MRDTPLSSIYPLANRYVPAFFWKTARLLLPLRAVLFQDRTRQSNHEKFALGRLFSFLISLDVIQAEFKRLFAGQAFGFHFLNVCILKRFHGRGPSGIFLF